MCELSAFRYFFKTNVAQSVAELILYSQKTVKHKMWSFSIRFGELKYQNVNNTFMIKWDGFRLKAFSVAHTLGEPWSTFQLSIHEYG